jgi:hypothetical protein
MRHKQETAVILHKYGAYRISVCGLLGCGAMQFCKQIQFSKNTMSIFWCELCRFRNCSAYNMSMLPGTWSLELNEGADPHEQEWSVGTWPLYGAHMFFVTGRKLNNNGLLQDTMFL